MGFENLIEDHIFQIIMTIFLGLVFGSFATALIYRIPRELPWILRGKSDDVSGVRSACTHCKNKLGVFDLIPLVSCIISKGKCRQCDVEISYVYPLTEILVLLGCLGIWAVFGVSVISLIMMMLIPILVALLVIDLQHMILPNILIMIGVFLGLITLSLKAMSAGQIEGEVLMLYIGGAALYAVFAWVLGKVMSLILKKDALGFGDVKFFGMAGLWLGTPALGWFCILSGVFGVVLASLWKMKSKTAQFPFGPALIFAFYAILLLQGSNFL